jgi:triosephosphate isomerase
MRQYLIAGNWKMHTTPEEASRLAASIGEGFTALNAPESVGALVCPPFISIYAAVEALKGSRVGVGGQNCHEEAQGAYTGEIAPQMLKAAGCSHVIIGHSERRAYFGETNTLLNKKVHAALKAGLTPIYCVGETLDERKAGTTLKVVRGQLREGLADIAPSEAASLVVAYEPVWAIGTGLAATAEQAQEVHAAARAALCEQFGDDGARIMLLYGGSLKPDNAEEIFAQADVQGGLIGGASLKADSFCAIAKAARDIALRS